MKTRGVLVVENDITLSQVLVDSLIADGIPAHYALTSQAGLDLLEKALPAAIVLDLRMPIMSGIEFATKVRENERTATIPILLITGASEDQARAACTYLQSIGSPDVPVSWLQKPFSITTLKDTLTAMVK